MIGVYTQLKIKPGCEISFEKEGAALVTQVQAKESHNCFYHLFKEGDGVYVFLEGYTNEAAFSSHKKSSHYNKHGALIRTFLDGCAVISIMKEEAASDIAPLNQIKVLAYKDKGEWTLETKYNIGKKGKTSDAD